jgi:membrane protease YdiL (CAAX protease family)
VGWVANAVAALCMVAVHMPAHGWAALAWGLPAMVLGELFRQSQRVWPCVALHAWFNACLWWASR